MRIGLPPISRTPSSGNFDFGISEPTGGFRRVVPSPLPTRIFGLASIRLLVEAGVCVICAGGGIPVTYNDAGGMEGVEAAIDKDCTAALLAQDLQADALLMLTDVESVYRNWGRPDQVAISTITPQAVDGMSFAAGSMGPKVAAATAFVRSGGIMAGIGKRTTPARYWRGSQGRGLSLPYY